MDDDFRITRFSLFVTFILLPSLLNIFSVEKEINVKDTEKSLITKFLSIIAKKVV